MEKVVKVESIANDKDGTLEKVYFEPRAVVEDGKTRISEPWEIRATGKKVNELKGAFKQQAPEMLHQGMQDWAQGGGDLKITRPDGSSDIVRADKEHLYRQMPGFCESRIRVGVVMPHMPWHKPCGHSKSQACHCEEEA